MIAPNKDGYLLLFRGTEWYKQIFREELQQVINQNKAWLERLAADGKMKAGQPLDRKGVIVSGPNGRHVSDGPFAESKEIIGGYLLIDVETFEEAVAIAQTCPTLAYGSSIEVRPLTDECPSHTREQALASEEQLAAA
ncbi:MAG TPA: YciI family protein [Verrucomicrobiae bacterium]